MQLKSGAQSERRLLAAGATLSVFGIAMSTGDLASLASVITLGGLLLVIVGLHRFGRTGADPSRIGASQPLRTAPTLATAKRKKAKREQARKARPAPPES
jgi:hypothetical protein